MTTPSETDIRLNPFFPSDEEFVKFMTTPTDKSEAPTIDRLIAWTKSRSTCLPIEAIHEAIEDHAALQSQLADLRAQMETKVEEAENAVDEQWIEAIAKRWVSLTGKPWETRDGETSEEGRHSNVTAIFQYIEDLKSQVERLHADVENSQGIGKVLALERDQLRAYVAVMRGECARMYQVIQTAQSHDHADGDDTDCVLCQAIKTVMDRPNCGADLLARYREAVTLLDTVIEHAAFIADDKALDWQDRRDTLLATVIGEVGS